MAIPQPQPPPRHGNPVAPRVGKHRKSLAIKYLFSRLTLKGLAPEQLKQELADAAGKKPKVKVINRNGVDIYITVDKRDEYAANRMRLINYEG